MADSSSHVECDSWDVCGDCPDDVVSRGDVGVKSECSDSDICHVLSVDDCEVDSLQVKEGHAELRRLQAQDTDLAFYIEYLERDSQPDNEHIARRVVLGSKQYEIIDGVLHYKDPLHHS